MFYIFKQTTEKTYAIGEYHDKENALAYMEHLWTREGAPDCYGYFLEDGTGTTIAGLEL